MEWVLYFLLLGLSYIFIDQTYQEYVEGRTNYLTSSHTLSTEDHPTISVCFDHTENLSFENMTFITIVANATDNETNTRTDADVELKEGDNIVRGADGIVRLIHLEKLFTFDERSWTRRNCFKMRQHFEDPEITMGFLTHRDGVTLGDFFIEFPEDNTTDHNAHLYMTSEENAYGIVVKHWYDGQVDHIPLKAGWYYNLSINGVDEYRYLKESLHHEPCVQESFYQCISNKLAEAFKDFTGEKCALFSLHDPTGNLTVCNHTIHHKDVPDAEKEAENTFWSLFNGPVCRERRTCTVREYKVVGRPDSSYEIGGSVFWINYR